MTPSENAREIPGENPAEQIHELTVPPAAADQRLDLFVKESLALPRSEAKRLVAEGRVLLDGRPAKKSVGLRPGQRVRVVIAPVSKAARADAEAPLDILWSDDALLFVNKPAGMPSHPLEANEIGTVANALVARHPECATVSDDPREAGLCHRLDVETSGVLLAARTREAWQAMREAFSGQGQDKGQVDKRYWALVSGPIGDEGEIDLPLRHHPRHADRVLADPTSGPGAREARSTFKVLARPRVDLSLVEVRIFTGVLHQVRAHLAAIGAPIVGDGLYGGPTWPGLGRFFLHARSLALNHPVSGEAISVQAPLPNDLLTVLGELGVPAP